MNSKALNGSTYEDNMCLLKACKCISVTKSMEDFRRCLNYTNKPKNSEHSSSVQMVDITCFSYDYVTVS